MSYQRQEDLLRRLKKDRDKKKGAWRDVGPRQPPKRRDKPNKKRTPDDDRESAVQREIVQNAARLGLKLWRQQAGKIFTGLYAIILAPAGSADLTGILPNGQRIEVECKKRYSGVQSDDQKAWQKYIEENNGIYILAHSGDEFQDKITPILKGML